MVWRVTTVFDGPQINGGGFNILHFSSSDTASNAAAAAHTFWNSVGPTMAAGNTCQVQQEVEDISDATGAIEGVEDSGSHAVISGANAGVGPPSVQGLIRLRTGIFVASDTTPPRTKEVRGRIFIPAVSTASILGGIPTSAVTTAWQNAANALLTDANSTLVVFSRVHNLQPAVATATVWNKFAVLRRRRD